MMYCCADLGEYCEVYANVVADNDSLWLGFPIAWKKDLHTPCLLDLSESDNEKGICNQNDYS